MMEDTIKSGLSAYGTLAEDGVRRKDRTILVRCVRLRVEGKIGVYRVYVFVPVKGEKILYDLSAPAFTATTHWGKEAAEAYNDAIRAILGGEYDSVPGPEIEETCLPALFFGLIMPKYGR